MQYVRPEIAVEAIRNAALDINLKLAMIDKVRTMNSYELGELKHQSDWFQGILMEYARQRARR